MESIITWVVGVPLGIILFLLFIGILFRPLFLLLGKLFIVSVPLIILGTVIVIIGGGFYVLSLVLRLFGILH